MEEKSNEFRNELEKKQQEAEDHARRYDIEKERVGVAVYTANEHFVMMRELQTLRKVITLDLEYNISAAAGHMAFIKELEALPMTEQRDRTIALIERQIATLDQAVQKTEFSRPSQLTLMALEDVLNVDCAKEATKAVADQEEPDKKKFHSLITDVDANVETCSNCGESFPRGTKTEDISHECPGALSESVGTTTAEAVKSEGDEAVEEDEVEEGSQPADYPNDDE